MNYEKVELCDFEVRCSNCGDNCDICLIDCEDSSVLGALSFQELSRTCSQSKLDAIKEPDPLLEHRVYLESEMAHYGAGFPLPAESLSERDFPVAPLRVAGLGSNFSLNIMETRNCMPDLGNMEEDDTCVLVLKIVAAVCLLFSLIIFLCALDDMYCLIPASCLLGVGIIPSVVLIALKLKELAARYVIKNYLHMSRNVW
ncbi:hypothetical protein [Candidatus Ichthyocystis hellenicum]|uniref:hypothetical protein n=1 Tax=Candidatus Ichthyocystis hellenicum TaxID=1561003 RepID=UPI000B85EB85|nr:hypothetical protein [Candidatus Ichthyocystis hellenicum]